MRMIDAERLRALIVAMYEPFPNICNVNVVLTAIDNAPTIEAEPLKHGRWIFREEATPEFLPWDMWCSCCGEYHDSDDYSDRYCSKCGAKMDGGADNGT